MTATCTYEYSGSSSASTSTTCTGSARAASRKARVYMFREFIHAKYPNILLPSPRPRRRRSSRQQGEQDVTVLDCAGGKGDLSWLLRNVDGIDSVVCDPGITKNDHILKSIQYLRDHPEEAERRSVPGVQTYQPLAALLPRLEDKTEVSDFASPRHMRILVDDDLVEAIRCYRRDHTDDKVDRWNQYWQSATRRGQEAMPLGYKEDDEADDIGADGQIKTAQEALETILSAKLVVGFHPDQATDPCIELAKELKIPYCVVPCCVFPSEFPDRRLADGSRVRCYSELIQYLQERHAPSIRTERLHFHFTETAKNLVLYELGLC